MYVKVKIIDDNGELKGRAYTYETDLDLGVGDLVVADMAGTDKVLSVTEVGIEVGEVNFEIKKIKRLATDEDDLQETVDMQIVEEQLPVIRINYDELKAALTEMLRKYKGLVVTAETLSGCKATQRELAGIRGKLDRWRIDKSKELSLPIEAFKNQCKELVALVEEVEKPIKEGIALFDDDKRAEKAETATKLIAEVVTQVGLTEKFAKQLTVIDKYCNLTATQTTVKDDLLARATALLAEQNREQDILDIITSTVEAENSRLKNPMNPEDFTKLIDAGLPAKDVISQIKLRADNIQEAEKPKEEPQEEPPKEVEPPVLLAEDSHPKHFAVYRVEGTESQLLGLSAFLRNANIKYKVEEQGRL